MKPVNLFAIVLIAISLTSCLQDKPVGKRITVSSEANVVTAPKGPQRITRNLIQDKKGNIWMAAFDGIFKYDGKFFTNIASTVSSARFFSILEDTKGNFWFGSIGSGVYYYKEKSAPDRQAEFVNFTTKDGLLNNEVTSIYEDKKGNIWFGVYGGASCYDGKTFRHYIIDGDEMREDLTGKTFPNRQPYEVTSMLEDKKGKFWFATRGNTFVFDVLPNGLGKTSVVFSHNSTPFKNVRSIIEDKKGNMWLGGADGLWRYEGDTFTNFTQKFVGYIMEDKAGNIWTSSESAKKKNWNSLQSNNVTMWSLSRYDENSLSNKTPTVTEITSKPLIFGILEDDKGSIWFGAVGAHRYNPHRQNVHENPITEFTNNAN